MGVSSALSREELLRLPPTIIGTIRWKASAGRPSGDLCGGFDIVFEEHTATQFRDAGGHAEPIPGTGIWKTISGSTSCRSVAEEETYFSVSLRFIGLHVNVFPDGSYRVTPKLRGNWRPSGLLAALLGYRAIEPASYTVVLTKADPIQVVAFEVVRRSWLSGRLLR